MSKYLQDLLRETREAADINRVALSFIETNTDSMVRGGEAAMESAADATDADAAAHIEIATLLQGMARLTRETLKRVQAAKAALDVLKTDAPTDPAPRQSAALIRLSTGREIRMSTQGDGLWESPPLDTDEPLTPAELTEMARKLAELPGCGCATCAGRAGKTSVRITITTAPRT